MAEVKNIQYVTVVSKLIDYVEDVVMVFKNRKLAEDWVDFYLKNPEAAQIAGFGWLGSKTTMYRIAEWPVTESFNAHGAGSVLEKLRVLEAQKKDIEFQIENAKLELVKF